MEQFFHVSDVNNALMIAYRVTLLDFQVEFKLDSREIVEIKFVPLYEAVKLNLFPEYRRALETYLSL